MTFRHFIRTKNNLYKYYLNKPTVYNEINYKRYRNKLNCLINVAEKAYYQHELHKDKGNLKNTRKIVKGIVGKKEIVTTIDQLLIEDKLKKNKQHIANKCNEYLTNIGPQLAEEIPMFLLPATPDEIRGIINTYKNSSPGWDGITPFILKQAFSNLLDPLCHIVYLSFDQ